MSEDNTVENTKLLIALLTGALVILLLALKMVMDNDDKKKKNNAPVALNPDEWRAFPLIDIKEISHDVKRFRFGLPSNEHRVGLPIGQHISLKYVDENDKEVIRSYTPTSSDDDLGFVDFVVKVYFKNVHPKFPEGGKMSQHLNSLKIGDTLLMKGPKGHLEYLGRGKFTITHKGEKTEYKKKKIGMIAGGTGITPMLQVISAILKDKKDETELWLIFANQSEEDILLREELENIQKSNDKFHLHYTVDRPPANWKYSSGFINEEMCRKHLPAKANDTMLFVCGPPPMIKFACEPAFKALGFVEGDWFSF